MNVDHLTQLNNSVFVSRLHVAMFTNVYRPLSNGVVTSVASFRRGLVERGHVVYVIPTPTKTIVMKRGSFRSAHSTASSSTIGLVTRAPNGSLGGSTG